MSPALTVSIDKEALKADAEKLLHGSPLWAKIQGGIVLNPSNPYASAVALGELVQAVIASVEVVKSNAKELGGGDALDLALTLLDDAVAFGGPFGRILEAVDRPVLHFMIECGYAAWKGKEWLPVAKGILALAV